ncbi:hypothetical protein, conserved [Babesia ovata]|uniref:C3H1-type domain-containing protein n=1 Tax=Babesia ovata TaxID=189622 RepID=A0A2H6KJ58_9APIC|nr:uncharacterized protein BOVATA_045110 [Babesia ovata]GBE63018.1 hypothetical protein, conserved [Babesia ovata]
MAFLHGVLESVKDDESVKKYDGYIDNKDHRLQKLLDSLQSSIGQGRSAFGARVDEVDQKNRNVTDGLSSLSGEYVQEITRQQDQSLEAQLFQWTTTLGYIAKDIHNITHDNISELDTALSTRIMHEIKPIEKSVEVLLRAAGNPDLAQQAGHVDSELVAHKTHIVNSIHTQSDILQKTLLDEVNKIGAKLNELNDKRQTQFGYVRSGVAIVKGTVEDAFGNSDDSFKNQFIQKFRDIKSALDDVNKHNFKNGDNGITRLRNEVNLIKPQLENVRRELEVTVAELGTWMNSTSKNINDAKVKYVDKIISKEVGKYNRYAMMETAAALEEWKDTLRNHINHVKDELKDRVRQAETAAKGLDTQLLADLGKLRGGIKSAVTEYAKGYVKKVKEQVEVIKGKSKGQGLQGFVEHVKEKYAEEFLQGKKGFGNLVQQWINEILQKDEFVQYCLDGYFTGSNNRARFQPPYKDWTIKTDYKGKTDGIAKAIKDALAKDVNITIKDAQTVPDSSTNKIQDHVNVAYTCVSDFATTLESKLNKGKIRSTNDDPIINDIVSAVEGALEMTQESAAGKTSKSYLQAAVKPILSALLSTAKHVAEQLKSLTGTNAEEIKKVDEAFAKAGELAGELGAALSSTAGTYTVDHNVSIKENIHEKFSQKVEEQFKKTHSGVGGDASGITVETTLEAYTGYKKGNVDTSIQAIKTYADSGFDVNPTTEKLGAWSTNITKSLNSLTDACAQTGQYINTYLYGLKTEYIDVKLANIRRQINTLQQEQLAAETGKIMKAINSVIELIKKLEETPGRVDEEREAAVKIMEQLRKQVIDKINDLELAVKQAKRELYHAINNSKNALADAYHTINDDVTTLKNELLRITENGFASIIREVRRLFAERHKADLESLKSLIKEQLEEIKEIINADLNNGTKGLVKAMNCNKHKIDEIRTLVIPSRSDSATKFRNISTYLHHYLTPLLSYTTEQVKAPSKGKGGQAPAQTQHPSDVPPGRAGWSPPEQSPAQLKSQQSSTPPDRNDTIEKYFAGLQYYVDGIFSKLSENRFSKSFATKRADFEKFLASMLPPNFSGIGSPLLDSFKSGLQKFLIQLSHAYISAYDGAAYSFKWEPGESEKCANVCLSILETMSNDLETLKERCKYEWHSKQIHRISGLGAFLKDCGYIVSNRDKQDGELRRHENMTGNHILQKLTTTLKNTGQINEHLKECESNKKNGTDTQPQNDDVKVFAILSCLITHFSEYNKVGHIATFSAKRTPCSVYEMLCWTTGLMYNNAYEKLKQHCQKLCDDEKDSHLKTILSKLHKDGLPYLFSNSRNILTTILGTGDEHTTYASDFSTNSLSLKYPGSGAECLDMLLDILRRLFLPLRFLDAQCSLSNKHYGWANCQYGKDIAPVNWPCKDHSTNKPNGQSASKPTCQANDQPNGQPNCRPTSPLMSYLNDCLPGHLPHQLIDAGCKSSCYTCKTAARGVPCLTPLGFRGFSGSTRLGKELCIVLTKLLDDADLRSLFCLKPKTPASLPEHFGFVLSLVKDWRLGILPGKNGSQSSFETSIERTSIHLYEHPNKLTDALRNAYGSSLSSHEPKKHLPAHDDLSSLSMTESCTDPTIKTLCAPYLSSLSCDSNYYLAQKHSNTYLSWAIYLPWTFWDLLNNLYNAFCEITCADWGCRGCLRGDKCKAGKQGVVEDDKKDVTCQCDSIVTCKGVAPTLYQYGFSFGEASTLNGNTPKKCKDFCTQLYKVLHSDYFDKLFEACDNFLCIIRWPFMLTLLALWSLSLLYLLHIAVVRLDVLRIRSHLRSPSSHRIAAQSLLAAARVRALASVKYFSP